MNGIRHSAGFVQSVMPSRVSDIATILYKACQSHLSLKVAGDVKRAGHCMLVPR